VVAVTVVVLLQSLTSQEIANKRGTLREPKILEVEAEIAVADHFLKP